MRKRAWCVAFFIVLMATSARGGVSESPGVVLIHGLARSAHSFDVMEAALGSAGYRTLNIDYPSREYPVEVLCRDYLAGQVNDFASGTDAPLCFVTHSMGGILLRYMVREGMINLPGRVVMLSPPNKGSEVVDRLGDFWLFKAVNGPAGNQLGTGQDQLPVALGPVPFELGVITGTRTINFFLSALIPGPDDGKVSVGSASVEGMADFRVLPVTHPFIMKNKTAIQQALFFLGNGRFFDPPLEKGDVFHVNSRDIP